MKQSIKLAQIGYGYWGPNLARNFYQIPDADFACLVDLDANARAKAEQLYDCATTDSYESVLEDASIEAIVVATPARTHHPFAKRALEAGKHVFVEKPLAMALDEAQELVALADEVNRVLMVGHVFEYNPAVRYIKQVLDNGDLGDVYYLYSRRVNLGRVQSDINALWSIAPHDISIALYLLDEMPEAVSCQGAKYLSGQVEDVIFMTLHFASGPLCHVHASWLDPSKTRELTVVGSHKMVVYDDVSSEGKVRIYDKGVYRKGDPVYGEFQYKIHSGDILIPRLEMREPLREECLDFIQSIQNGKKPHADGQNGLNVVKVLAAAQESLDSGGAKVTVKK